MDLSLYKIQRDFAKRYRAEGQARLLIRLLTQRFGELPGTAAAHVRAATPEQLELFADRVLTAETLEEVLE